MGYREGVKLIHSFDGLQGVKVIEEGRSPLKDDPFILLKIPFPARAPLFRMSNESFLNPHFSLIVGIMQMKSQVPMQVLNYLIFLPDGNNTEGY